jgi:hypothetical protein
MKLQGEKMPAVDEVLDYSRFHWRTEIAPRARVRIYEPQPGPFVLIASTPDKDYQGYSITNGIEKIVAAAFEKWVWLTTDLAVIEHYPAWVTWKDEESFDLVTFARWGRTQFTSPARQCWAPSEPSWTPTSRAEVEKLVGEKVDA